MELIKKLFYSYTWCCAYRVLKDEEIQSSIIPRSEEVRNYTLIKVPPNRWIADPFLLEAEGETYAFFELMHMKKNKAVIGSVALPQGENEVRDVFEFDGHTSYPCVFRYNDAIYMIPETQVENSINLMKCVTWPNHWEKVGILCSDIAAADCTPFFMNDKAYIFVYEIGAGNTPHRILHIGEIDFENKRIRNLRKVKTYQAEDGRPGGHVFFENGSLIRVVQPCEKHYGERLDFYRFSYREGKYSEEKCGEFLPSQIRLDQKMKINGVHTINRYGKYEIIDIRGAYKFSLWKPLVKLCQYFGLFGYDWSDRKKERIL